MKRHVSIWLSLALGLLIPGQLALAFSVPACITHNTSVDIIASYRQTPAKAAQVCGAIAAHIATLSKKILGSWEQAANPN